MCVCVYTTIEGPVKSGRICKTQTQVNEHNIETIGYLITRMLWIFIFALFLTFNRTAFLSLQNILNGPRRQKTQSGQRLCYSLIGKYHTCIKTCYKRILKFSLVSVAEETGLHFTSSETPKTGFLASRPKSGW